MKVKIFPENMEIMLKEKPSPSLRYYEYSVIVVLAAAVLTGILTATGAKKILHAYEDNCIFSAKRIYFSAKESESLPFLLPLPITTTNNEITTNTVASTTGQTNARTTTTADVEMRYLESTSSTENSTQNNDTLGSSTVRSKRRRHHRHLNHMIYKKRDAPSTTEKWSTFINNGLTISISDPEVTIQQEGVIEEPRSFLFSSEPTIDPTMITTTEKPKIKKIHPHIFRAFWSKKDLNKKDSRKHETDEIPEGSEEDCNMTCVNGVDVDTQEDFTFLSSNEVNVITTTWGYYSECEYFVFYPLFGSIVAIIWSTMLFMFRGGYNWGLPKPWRIVVPSIVLFFLMFLLAVIYTVYSKSKLNAFCQELRYNITTKTLKCGDLLQMLQPNQETRMMETSVAYSLFSDMAVLNICLWAVALAIMIARCVFVVDFRLVRVTISTIGDRVKSTVSEQSSVSDSKEELEESSVKLCDQQTQGSPPFYGNEKRSNFSSREELDDYHSAISDVEMTSIKSSDQSSMQPLLERQQTSELASHPTNKKPL